MGAMALPMGPRIALPPKLQAPPGLRPSCDLDASSHPARDAEKMVDLVRKACLASPALSELFPSSRSSTAPGTATPSELCSEDEFASEALRSDHFSDTGCRWRLVGVRMANVFREAAEDLGDADLNDVIPRSGVDTIDSDDPWGRMYVPTSRDWRQVGARMARVFREIAKEPDTDDGEGPCGLPVYSPFSLSATESTDTPTSASGSEASEPDEPSGPNEPGAYEWQRVGVRLANVFREASCEPDSEDDVAHRD